jgi:4-hydroxy-4-methyl-2-oxoglutarate aldolase
MTEVSNDVLDSFRELGTTHVSDALDRLRLPGQCLGIAPLDHSFRLVGRAYTIRYVPLGAERGDVGDYIDDVPDGHVPVLDNGGRLDATVWGDLLTATALRRGLPGTVIDGVCRDSDRSLALGYPIFSRGTWMRTGKDRVGVDAYQVAVSIGGARVEPGDVLVGDGDGLVAVPAARALEVLGVAREIRAAEDQIRTAVETGARLDEARAARGYYDLQRPH